jgi:hypothetical protein
MSMAQDSERVGTIFQHGTEITPIAERLLLPDAEAQKWKPSEIPQISVRLVWRYTVSMTKLLLPADKKSFFVLVLSLTFSRRFFRGGGCRRRFRQEI